MRKDLIEKAIKMIKKEEKELENSLKYYRKRDGSLNSNGSVISGFGYHTINMMEKILKIFREE